mmetsp:Transcript_87839/g.179154  ORF Transcript_87839/g.179154 Transcript_87839/m.179154 type:complete len:365 (-) Transcript_87839:125-1219(-)
MGCADDSPVVAVVPAVQQVVPNAPPAAELPAPLQAVAQTVPPIVAQLPLQVKVPTAVVAGQKVAFTTPDGQNMCVTVPEALAPGSFVSVQYPPLTATSSLAPTTGTVAGPLIAPLLTPHLPTPTAQAEAIDRNEAQAAWALYGCGWLMCCAAPMCTPLCWIPAAALYFCKPAAQRAQARHQRVPALATVSTVALCVACAALAFIVFCLVSTWIIFNPEGARFQRDLRHFADKVFPTPQPHTLISMEKHDSAKAFLAPSSWKSPRFTDGTMDAMWRSWCEGVPSCTSILQQKGPETAARAFPRHTLPGTVAIEEFRRRWRAASAAPPAPPAPPAPVQPASPSAPTPPAPTPPAPHSEGGDVMVVA